jgi:hypothetical protein
MQLSQEVVATAVARTEKHLADGWKYDWYHTYNDDEKWGCLTGFYHALDPEKGKYECLDPLSCFALAVHEKENIDKRDWDALKPFLLNISDPARYLREFNINRYGHE